ncbi:MAG: PAS domain S-box protein [Rariglobus sp.]
MKIRTKVLVGFTLLLAVVLIHGLVEYRHATSAKRDLNLFEFSSLRETVIANELLDVVAHLELALAQGTSAGNFESGTTISGFSTLMEKAVRATSAGISLAEANGNQTVVEEELAELNLLKDLDVRFGAVAQKWHVLSGADVPADQRWLLAQQALAELQRDVKPLVRQYRDNSIDELLEHSERIQQRADLALLWMLGAALTAFIVTALASYWIVRTVMKPLYEAVGAANEITQGNLHRRLRVDGNDEFALLASSFNQMLDNLAATAGARDELRLLANARAVELDNLFTVATDAIAIAGRDGFFVRINSAFPALLGYTEEEMLKRPFLDFVHPDDRDMTRAESAKLLLGEASADFENRQLCSDGSFKWLSWSARVHLASGLFYAIGRDVTAKKATEFALQESQDEFRRLNESLEQMVATRTEKLRESEEGFRRLVDGVKDYAIFMLDAEGLIVSWNASAERIHGYLADEIVGRHFSKFYRPQDVALDKPSQAIRAARETGRFEETAWRSRDDGRDFLALTVITAIRDDEGHLRGFASIVRDITKQQQVLDELEQQQGLFRLLMENLAEGVVACDAAGKLTFFNKTAREWHGTNILDIPPDRWPDSFGLYAADGVTPLLPAQIPLMRATAGERIRDVEMVLILKDHPARHIVVSGDALQDASGQTLGAVVVMHDVTDRRNAERHNLRTQRLESIGTLSGGIAHDLNNALSPILMGIELLKMRYPDSSSFLDAMETSAKRGASMVRQLLTFAKGVDGQRVPLQPHHLIAEIESIIERTFPKNIELVVNLGETLRPILGDSTQIHQVLLNLCVNARDAMPDGGTLTIEAQNHTVDALYASNVPNLKPGRHIRIQIRDTGTGIPPAIIERIFEPFFSTKGPDRGTGLGLSTVIGIVRSHSGCVQVYSTPGEGTLFSVYLPVAEEGADVSATPFAPNIGFEGNGRFILVVEDEPAVREIARAVLTSLDFKVITATDGEDAMRHLTADQPKLSLVITDFHMPKMDGLSFVKIARELMPGTPIIVSSGRLEKSDADQLAALGVRSLLHKPFTQGDLVKSLQHVFTHGSSQPFRTLPV